MHAIPLFHPGRSQESINSLVKGYGVQKRMRLNAPRAGSSAESSGSYEMVQRSDY